MHFDPFEVSVAHISYALLGGFVVIFGMFSLWLKARLYISEAVWATLFGIIVGPYGAGIFNPRAWAGNADDEEGVEVTNAVTLEVMRVVLAIGVFAIAVELPKAYLWRHLRSVLLILFPVMAWGWVVCAALIYGLVPGLSFLSSLIVAACLTPTDPILASAVVGGKWADKHVPAHLRHLLAAESGVNDGLAFPFLYIALYLFLENGDAKVAVGEWFYWTILYEVTLGCVIGMLMGVGFRHLMQFCERKDLIDRTSYLAQYISLALLAIGVTTLLGSDDLLCAFFAGTGFGWNGFFQQQTEDSMFSNAMDLLFNVAAFIYIGAWLPFSSYADVRLTLSVWRLVIIGILIILVRRLPICIAVYTWIPDIKTFREALFTGHFGPMGVGAVFISTLAAMQLPSKGALGDAPYSQEQLLSGSLQPIVSFIVLCSILSHGLSVPVFSLSKRVHSMSMSVHATRSWSRHPSMDVSGGHAEPEWATQARRVHRPEDIVVNRDAPALTRAVLAEEVDLEKGLAAPLGAGAVDAGVEREREDVVQAMRREGEELGPMDRENEKPRGADGVHTEGGAREVEVGAAEAEEAAGASPVGTSGTSGSGTRVEGLDAVGEMDRGRERGRAGSRERSREREGRHRSGSVTSWKEGNWLVIERDPGRGEEVQVEVVRDSSEPSARGSQTFTGSTLDEARAAGRAYVEKLETKARQIRAELLREGRLTAAMDQARARYADRTSRRLSGVSLESSSAEGGAAGSAEHGENALELGLVSAEGAGAGPSGTRQPDIQELGQDPETDTGWREEPDASADPDVVRGLPEGEPVEDDVDAVEEDVVYGPGRSINTGSTNVTFREPSSSPPPRRPHYPHHQSRFITHAKRAIAHAAHAPSRRKESRRSLLAGRGAKNSSTSPTAGAGPSSPTAAAPHPQRSASYSSRSSPTAQPRPILASATSSTSLRGEREREQGQTSTHDSQSPAPSTTSLPSSAVPFRLFRSPSPTARGSRGSSPARSVRFSDAAPRNSNGLADGVGVPANTETAEPAGNGTAPAAPAPAANTSGSRVRFDPTLPAR